MPCSRSIVPSSTDSGATRRSEVFLGKSGYNQRARSLARRETEWHIGPYHVQKFHGLDCQWLT